MKRKIIELVNISDREEESEENEENPHPPGVVIAGRCLPHLPPGIWHADGGRTCPVAEQEDAPGHMHAGDGAFQHAKGCPAEDA